MAVCLLSGRKSKLVVRLQKAEGEFGGVRDGFPMALGGIRQLLNWLKLFPTLKHCKVMVSGKCE